jgi:glycosyltransferase involved in cell wall biosynthesis
VTPEEKNVRRHNAANHPRFTVLLPTCDRPKMLPRAIRSVRSQTVPDWEIVLFDVGGTAATIPADDRIRVFYGDPEGPAAGFAAALKYARGSLIVPLSDDDELTPDALATAAKHIGDHEWLVARTELRNRGGSVEGYRGGPVHVEMTRRGEYMLGGAIFWRKTLTDRVGGFDPAFPSAPDFDLYTRFLAVAEPAVIEDVLYIRHDHDQTDSSRFARQQGESAARVRARLCAS